MRIALVGIFLTFFFIISLPLYVVAFILGRIDVKKQVAFSQVIVKGVFRVILAIAGVKIECSGTEKVPKDEAIMYIGNHRSYVDILIGYCTVPTLTGFVSKDELGKVPFIRIWMRFLKCLFINRESGRDSIQVILKGIEQIKEGFSVFIMPEGTRNSEEGLLPFHEGSFKLSTKTGCAIVPVAMKNTDKVINNHFAWFRPMKVTVVYGEPVYPDSLEKEDKKFIGAYMHNIMKEMLDNMD